MNRREWLVIWTNRVLIASLTLSLLAGLTGPAMARGGGGHGSGQGEVESHGGGGRHGGEGIETHGGRHGSLIRELPGGHIEFSHRGDRLFFHEGRFFNRHRDGYIIVGAPLGVIVPGLWAGAATVSVGGLTYYVTDDNYYRRTTDGFVVVAPPIR